MLVYYFVPLFCFCNSFASFNFSSSSSKVLCFRRHVGVLENQAVTLNDIRLNLKGEVLRDVFVTCRSTMHMADLETRLLLHDTLDLCNSTRLPTRRVSKGEFVVVPYASWSLPMSYQKSNEK